MEFSNAELAENYDKQSSISRGHRETSRQVGIFDYAFYREGQSYLVSH